MNEVRMTDTMTEASDDTVCVDTKTAVQASAPGGDLDSTVFGNAWLWANDSEAPIGAIDAPVEDSDSYATVTFEKIWATKSWAPVEALALAGDFHEVPVSDDGLFWTTTPQSRVETLPLGLDSDCGSAFSGDFFFPPGLQLP